MLADNELISRVGVNVPQTGVYTRKQRTRDFKLPADDTDAIRNPVTNGRGKSSAWGGSVLHRGCLRGSMGRTRPVRGEARRVVVGSIIHAKVLGEVAVQEALLLARADHLEHKPTL